MPESYPETTARHAAIAARYAAFLDHGSLTPAEVAALNLWLATDINPKHVAILLAIATASAR